MRRCRSVGVFFVLSSRRCELAQNSLVFYILLCIRVQSVLKSPVQCSGSYCMDPGLESNSSRPFPRLGLAAISVTTSQCSPSPTSLPERTPPVFHPQEQSRACAAQRLFCSSSPLLALDPKSSNDPWGFLLQVAKVLDRSPPHLSVSVSARQPFDDDEYRRTSSLSRGSTSESGAISVIQGLHR